MLLFKDCYSVIHCDSPSRNIQEGKSRFTVVRMEKGKQVMIITIAFLTQKNVAHDCELAFAHPYMGGLSLSLCFWIVKRVLICSFTN